MQPQQSSLPRRRPRYPVHKQGKKKSSRIKRCLLHPSHATISLFAIFILTTLSYNQQQSSFLFFTQAQQTNDDNPQNKFCGISYKEAHQFCHLPPHQSLPCPNGANTDCPNKLQCWTIKETCTQPPTTSPTLLPSFSPISRKSPDPTDHYFCGIGFDNLFDCARPCPGGDSAECPTGQICYFNTPCDARIKTKPTAAAATTATDDITADDSSSEEVGRPESSVVEDGEGDRNFCGRTVTEAMESCSRDKHCPSGLNGEW
jgi:hypothetical protein